MLTLFNKNVDCKGPSVIELSSIDLFPFRKIEEYDTLILGILKSIGSSSIGSFLSAVYVELEVTSLHKDLIIVIKLLP